MSSIQAVRTELSTFLSTLGQVYDYLPGSAQLPALVIGLPARVDHSVTTGYWRLDIPVYVITRSAEPLAGETELLDLVVDAVALLKANRTGTTFSTLKVVDTTDLYPITVGAIEAGSAQVNVELMIPVPT
jgi:hypothetical protein|tara:strand:+ start:380 stop:769 length:390 start_codon:yes stop_codon:yes gene_type:complete